LVYSYGGQVYTRTYTKHAETFNIVESNVDTFPFGFFFLPPPTPPLVPLYGETTLNSMGIIGGASLQSGQPFTGTVYPDPSIITPPKSTLNLTTSATLLSVDGYNLAVGLTSTPLKTTAFNVKRVTILAASTNTGTLYISGSKNQSSGQGFPLVAGAAKDIGLTTDTKDLDLSSVFLIGTNASDQAFIEYEK
jgi:hypothetical protein